MKFALVGDVMLGRLVNASLKDKPPDYPWGDTLGLLQNADLRVCNLECVLSDVGQPWSQTPKFYHFRTDEKNIATLLAADIGMVSLANNHVLDYEYEGLLRMMKVLGSHAINYAGAGRDSTEAVEPAICDVGGTKVGLIAFTDNEPDWEATDEKPGTFFVPIMLSDKRAKLLINTIVSTRDDVDVLIVSAHWGPNWGYEPPSEHIPFAHALIDAGADIVFGHSGHVFRGIEVYKQKPILYCTGNFVDDYAVDEIERNDESFVFLLETDRRDVGEIILYPTHIRDYHATRAKGIASQGIAIKMQKLCTAFKTEAVWDKKREALTIPISDRKKNE